MRPRAPVAIILLAAVAWLWSGEAAWSDPGDLLWEDRFDTGDLDFPAPDPIAAAGFGVFVAGSSTGPTSGDTDFLVRAYDPVNGTLHWDNRFDLAARNDQVLGITAGDGKVFASGNATTAAGILVPVIRAYDGRTGALLWQDVGAGQGLFDSAAVDGGRVFAVGAIGEDPSPTPGSDFRFRSDWLVRAYDVGTGALLWENRFGAPDPVETVQRDRLVTVAAGQRRVFVGGRARTAVGELSRRWFVRAYDGKTGTLLWQDQVSGQLGQANSIAVAGNRLVAVGNLGSPQLPFNQDWLIRAYDAKTGEILWQTTVDNGISELESASDVAVSRGRVFVAGTIGATCRDGVVAPDDCDGLIRAYDLTSGQFLWEDRFAEAPLDTFRSVAARGNWAFVVGTGSNDCDESGLPTNCDMIVRAYDAKTGQLVWENRVDKAGTDEDGNGIAVHGRRVFAAGTFFDANFSADLLVQAYDNRQDDEDDDDDE